MKSLIGGAGALALAACAQTAAPLVSGHPATDCRGFLAGIWHFDSIVSEADGRSPIVSATRLALEADGSYLLTHSVFAGGPKTGPESPGRSGQWKAESGGDRRQCVLHLSGETNSPYDGPLEIVNWGEIRVGELRAGREIDTRKGVGFP